MARAFLVQDKHTASEDLSERIDRDTIRRVLTAKRVTKNDEVFFVDAVNNGTVVKGAERLRYKIVPVGTIGFVQNGMDVICGEHIPMKPIEVPEVLRPFCHRKYEIQKGSDIPKDILHGGDMWFLKDADTLKGWNNLFENICAEGCIQKDTRYVISERVEIFSEYRVFVHRDEILAVQNYAGDPCIFPDGNAVRQMVEAYRHMQRPKSYTLDIAVANCKTGIQTIIIEVHPFVSCGLYGFCDENIPEMLADGIDWYIGQKKGGSL